MKDLNKKKVTFSPGPGAVIPEWFNSQKEFFGRGDKEYNYIKKKTIDWLKFVSGQDKIVPISGSATTAAIVGINSFLSGNILVIETGYYSSRWLNYLVSTKKKKNVKSIKYEDFIKKKYVPNISWVVFVYVETASCLKFDLKKIYNITKKSSGKLFLDATASIGLEKNHHLADVLFFSSCKGLFGPTGLGFLGHKKKLIVKNHKDFWLDYKTHEQEMYTLGYNCIASLYSISKYHNSYLKKINFAGKILEKYSISSNRPKIGIALKYKIINKNLQNSIFYLPRKFPGYDVIFFLGLIKFNKEEIKNILKKRIIDNLDLNSRDP